MTRIPLRRCDGVHRRDLLHWGVLSAFGLQWADLLRAAETTPGAASKSLTRGRAKACILLWLDGGPSHLETFDLKPGAPSEIRGPFRPQPSNVPGIEICEHLPRTAEVCHELAIIRSLTSPLGEHGLANHYLLTGYPPTPVLQYASYGSVVSRLQAPGSVLPPYVAIPEARSAGAGFLGASYEPFVTGGDPSHPDFRVPDLNFFPGLDERRLQRRREYLAEMDAAQAAFEARDAKLPAPFEQAYRLATSPHAKQAFDLHAESESVRATYGPRMFGQSCLMARRLVEHGVPFVTVFNSGWDTHEGLVLSLRDGYSGAKQGVGLLPTFDAGFAALVTDLAQRGMLEETLVVAMGEFGRTPKLNPRGGRDHWPRVFSVVLAGGGVRGGQVIGESDRVGESPRDNPITPADLACTIYSLLGIDPTQELLTDTGRPIAVNQGGRFITGLV